MDNGITDQYDHWYFIVISVLIWLLIYHLLALLLTGHEKELPDRILTLIHGSTCALVGLSRCKSIEVAYQRQIPITELESLLLVFSIGYFIFDLIWMYIYSQESRLMYTHHIYAVIALIRFLYDTYNGCEACCALGVMEISNPYLQTRWLLKYSGYRETQLYTVIELAYAIIFFIARVFVGGYFLIIAFRSQRIDIIVLTIAIGIISYQLIVDLLRFLNRKYFTHLSREHEDISNDT